ncbi:hypothetical protein U8Q06_12560 [Rhizobium beringeri]|uniref:hypothetical protein n=1 Tax=Rhizobium beringeri TaxID=3019934 RepID=UPI002E155B76|nr:hypothetical protein U8Q06_12560 [Rhizobium beringeri]
MAISKKKNPEPTISAQPDLRGLSQADQEMYADARKCVDWFVDYLGDDGTFGEIRDERELAAPRNALVNAFRVLLAIETDEK